MKNPLIARIAEFGKYLKFSEILLGCMYWLLSVLTIWLTMFLLDNLLALPTGLRLPLAIAGTLFMTILFFKRIFVPVRKKESIERTALTLEKKFNIPGNLLINSCQLSRRAVSGESVKIVEMTIDSSLAAIEGKSFFEKRDKQKIFKYLLFVAAVAVLWGGYLFLFPNFAENALNRYIMPMKDLPPASSFELNVAPSKDIHLFEGDDLIVRCVTTRRGGKVNALELSQTGQDDDLTIAWKLGGYLPSSPKGADTTAMKRGNNGKGNEFLHKFANVKRSFAFRVFGAGTYSKSAKVSVIPQPKITKSRFIVNPPAYIGEKRAVHPGPPALLRCLPGSSVTIEVELDAPVDSLAWKVGNTKARFAGNSGKWSLSGVVSAPAEYELSMFKRDYGRKVRLASGAISLISDQSPVVEFQTDDRNRLVNPGSELKLPLEASDDYGIKNISIVCERIDQREKRSRILKTWNYLGPPGKAGPVAETFSVRLNPSRFQPGETYVFRAKCGDFTPNKQTGTSKPLIIRIQTLDELNAPNDSPLKTALEYLKKTIKLQKKANAIAENARINLSDILKNKHLSMQSKTIKKQQRAAMDSGVRTIAEFKKNPEGKQYVERLTGLVTGEMKLVLKDVDDMASTEKAECNIASVAERQKFILDELIALLGTIVEDNQSDAAVAKNDSASPEAQDDDGIAESMAKSIKNDLKEYLKDQKRILEVSKKLRDKAPEDLTDDEEKILGELARDQSKWAKLFEEKLTDWSKLPSQDFSDGSIAQEFNEVFQEVKLAAKSLYEKKVEIAVPHEQSGVESAEKLVHNLEKWLPDTPDFQKWEMEDPKTPLDIPLAELPDELEDIVGELMDSEEEMTQDVEDVTSQWMDSLDKGAGWDAADGPISNMSAKGVTGNRLPNQNEVGGRSGEGRTGRSHGQMVEATAEGKGGRQTPTRLTPSPFETGSIEDSSKEATGGSTGGGKLSGFTGDGLLGPAPPEIKQAMARLEGNQSKIRQQAERMALKLSAHNLPSGDIESAVLSMKEFENATKRGDGRTIKKSYSRIMNYLKQARSAVKDASSLRKEKVRLPKTARNDILKSLGEGIPKGYETMVGEYFKALSQK